MANEKQMFSIAPYIVPDPKRIRPKFTPKPTNDKKPTWEELKNGATMVYAEEPPLPYRQRPQDAVLFKEDLETLSARNEEELARAKFATEAAANGMSVEEYAAYLKQKEFENSLSKNNDSLYSKASNMFDAFGSIAEEMKEMNSKLRAAKDRIYGEDYLENESKKLYLDIMDQAASRGRALLMTAAGIDMRAEAEEARKLISYKSKQLKDIRYSPDEYRDAQYMRVTKGFVENINAVMSTFPNVMSILAGIMQTEKTLPLTIQKMMAEVRDSNTLLDPNYSEGIVKTRQ